MRFETGLSNAFLLVFVSGKNEANDKCAVAKIKMAVKLKENLVSKFEY